MKRTSLPLLWLMSKSGTSRHFAAMQWLVRFRGTAEARERMISGQDGANGPITDLAMPG